MSITPVSAAVTASGPSITLGTHQAGDLIVIVATKGGSSTVPSLPAGWTSVFTASAADSVRVGYKVAASGSETSGSWTNAEDLAAVVYRGPVEVGAVAWATSSGLPALTLLDGSGNSWVMAATWNPSTPATPTGMTSRVTGTYARVADTNAGVASWSAQGGYVQDFGAVVEIRSPLTLVTSTATTSWDVLALVTSSVSTSWDVRMLEVTSTAATSWDVLALVTSSVSTSWDVASRGTWLDYMASTEFEDAVDAQQMTVEGRVEMVDHTGTPVLDLAPDDATINFAGPLVERWQCDVTITNPDLTPRQARDVLDPRAGLRAQVWWRVLVAGAWAEVPVGRYHLEDPDIADSPSEFSIRIKGRDSLVIAKRGGYGGQVLDVSGLTITEALTRLFAAAAPSLPVRVAQTDQTVPGALGSGTVQLGLDTTTVSQDWAALAASAGWTVRTDREGTVVAGPVSAPRALRAQWQEGPRCAVESVQRAVVQSEIVNRVLVRSTVRTLTEPVWAVAEDTDEGSPTWIGGPFGVRQGDPIETDVADTYEGVLNIARTTLVARRHPVETVTLTVPPRPDLDFLTPASLRFDRSGVGGIHHVSDWSLRIGPRGSNPEMMTVKMMPRSVVPA